MTYNLKYINAYNQSIEFSFETGFIISKTTGLTDNTIDTVNSQGINQIGGTLKGQSVKPRIITCKGVLMGDSTLKRQQMINTILPTTPARIIYNDTWQIDVVPKSTPDISSHNENADFDFILEAAYSYWRKTTESVTAMSEMKPMFKFPWNLTKMWKFGERLTPESMIIRNEGNVPTEFTVTFFAITAAKNPSLIKLTTLEFIRINRDMVAGETITVRNNSNRVDVYSSIGGDIFNQLDFDSTLFLLDVGDNILRYEAAANREAIDVRIIRATTSVGAYTV